MLLYNQEKYQIPKRTKELRGQLYGYLYRMCDTITIESAQDIDPNRILVFSHPFEDWIFDYLREHPQQRFFHIDNGYIGNHRHKTPWYYRISYNSLQNTVVNSPDDTRTEFLELDEKIWRDWSDSGEYNLLVLPNQSNIFRYLGEDYTSWREKTIAHYQSLDIPLIIREKEGKRRQRYESIMELVEKSKKVIVYHSMTAVEALCMGKPVEVLGQSAVEHWNNQFGFDRTELLRHIAWSQFDRHDFESGLAWRLSFDYQVNRVDNK